MSVIGIDFGNESCYVAAARSGGIETLANDYSLRATPSIVAFDGKKRIIGVAAKNQQVTNMKNTVGGFKLLVGRKFKDQYIEQELRNMLAYVDEREDGGINIKVNYLHADQQFGPEELTAMLLTKLKETSVAALQTHVKDCVIACPVYFTNAERYALLDAAHIAGLNVLRLMNETTAIALAYGFYKNELFDETPRNVVFVDFGHSSLQTSVCAFTNGKLRMLASAWDQIGGRDFDLALANHFTKEFQQRYKINVKINARANLRLLTEVERLKRQMSANSTKLPMNIECFMNDIDVTSSMQRSQMEEICAPLLQRVEQTFKRLLFDSKLQEEDIHSVEIVGGSTRIPAVKILIGEIFNKAASTTLNQDEAVSRGAAIQCAIMSPAVRVREYSVTDIQNYGVKVYWTNDNSSGSGDVVIFSKFNATPFTRLLTIKAKIPFNVSLVYGQQVPYLDQTIGVWKITANKQTESSEPQEVKLKISINTNGIVLITSATLLEKKLPEEAAMDPSEQTSNENKNTGETNVGGEGKKLKSAKSVELQLEAIRQGFSLIDLETYTKQEATMIVNDLKETERIDARNTLEEFVYDIRNKLQDGPLERFIETSERDHIIFQLNEIEIWLYESGENCDRETYVKRLQTLQKQIDPIKARAEDYGKCPSVFEELKNRISFAFQVVQDYQKGQPMYEHLTETDFLNISEMAEKKQKWLNEKLSLFNQSSPTTDSPVHLSNIRQEIKLLNNCINSVINRAKPKIPSLPKSATNLSTKNEDDLNDSEASPDTVEKMSVDSIAQSGSSDPAMDVE